MSFKFNDTVPDMASLECGDGSCSEDEELIRKGIVLDGHWKDNFTSVLRPELSDVPFEDLQKIRQKIGTKRFDSALKESLEERKVRSFKRANKNRYKSTSCCAYVFVNSSTLYQAQ